MDITRLYNLDETIRELEMSLQLDGRDYEERDMSVTLSNIRTRISRQYKLDLSEGKITNDAYDMGVYKSAVVIFLENMALIHGTLCGYAQLGRFLSTTEISLADVNYLGYTQESLEVALQALQRKATLPQTDDVIKSISAKLGTINISREKRLFVLMVICHEIGLDEIVACIAEILYIGGKMR